MVTKGGMRVSEFFRRFLFFLIPVLTSSGAGQREKLWSLRPLTRPEIPAAFAAAPNPIDAFVMAAWAKKGLQPTGPADNATLLRRVYLDLTGLPPEPRELEAFLADSSSEAYNQVVDRLLASDQHGVRYARHWMDVLRYADLDNHMPAEPGIYHWRDWIISALNRDLPYDRFMRAQIAGDRSGQPDEIFATGFLARGAQTQEDKEQELAFGAVETVSTAFMGMTVGCARCHDHMFDPIMQRDYYSMKALFDPLVLEKKTLATADQIFAYSRSMDQYREQKAALEAPLRDFAAPFKSRLLEERILMLPAEVQQVVRKPEKERTLEERKIADDYGPILRIDKKKILEIMTAEQRARYEALERPIRELKEPSSLPEFWAVGEDAARSQAKNHILLGGDPTKPGAEVTPGFPFAPAKVDFSGGRRQAFADWLAARDNPLFARVAVNRLWQWHFGEGIVTTSSDFGFLGEKPANPELLDWLASEFVQRKFSMKAIHRLIVTSDVYRLASTASREVISANTAIDPANRYLARFPVKRLEAETIRDVLYSVSGDIDLTVGGKSFREGPVQKYTGGDTVIGDYDDRTNRRGVYMGRGFHGDAEMLPAFLQIFDADDGRRVCPRRNRTVTAPQALAMMNSPMILERAAHFAGRLRRESGGTPGSAVDLGYRIALSRRPTPHETDAALTYLGKDLVRLDGFAWMLLNLDELIYQR
jgi:hypothetical protein